MSIQHNMPQRGRSHWQLAAPLAALVTGAWLWLGTSTPPRTQQQTEKDAIALCWRDQARPSLPPAEARFVASTCEMMAGKYRQAYGVDP